MHHSGADFYIGGRRPDPADKTGAAGPAVPDPPGSPRPFGGGAGQSFARIISLRAFYFFAASVPGLRVHRRGLVTVKSGSEKM